MPGFASLEGKISGGSSGVGGKFQVENNIIIWEIGVPTKERSISGDSKEELMSGFDIAIEPWQELLGIIEISSAIGRNDIDSGGCIEKEEVYFRELPRFGEDDFGNIGVDDDENISLGRCKSDGICIKSQIVLIDSAHGDHG